jgi:phosphatidate cytidylyltransferase
MKSNLALRLLTAAVAVPLLLLLLYEGPAWGLYPLALLATLIGAWELFGMTHAEDTFGRVVGLSITGVVSAALFFFGADARVLVAIMAAVPLAGPMITLARLGDMETVALRAAALGFGPLFVGLPLTLLAVMRRDVGGNAGAGYVVLALMSAWFSDTGGYFAGRFFGKHRLYEAVSPKKTWEGAAGGLLGSALGAVMAHFWYLKEIPLVHALLLAIIAGVLGQVGDLAESLFKRSTGVKDSGRIVPGHGGILDRVDALLVTATCTYLYTVWLR